MGKCGICVLAEAVAKCSCCRVRVCENCYNSTDEWEAFFSYRNKICKLCHKNKPYDYWFCITCDVHVIYNDFYKKCVKCFDKKTTIENRLLLPHRKARPIIETYYIPDIAQLIFDYYYVPRRYFDGEE
jgi:hypothetical protein